MVRAVPMRTWASSAASSRDTSAPSTRAAIKKSRASLSRIMSVLLEGFLALGAHARQRHDDQQQRRRDQQAEADRPVDEDHRVAARDPHGAAQILLHHRAEDESKQHGGGLAVELEADIAEHPEHGGEHDLE